MAQMSPGKEHKRYSLNNKTIRRELNCGMILTSSAATVDTIYLLQREIGCSVSFMLSMVPPLISNTILL